MSLLIFQHNADETPALLGTVLQQQGHQLQVVKLYEQQPVPTDLDNIQGLVIMGGHQNVDQTEQYPWLEAEMALIKQAHEAGLPVVGICLGAQLIAKALGGEVAPMKTPEVGWHSVKLAFPGTIDAIYGGIRWDSEQCHMHGYEVSKLPGGATPLAGSAACRTQAFKVGLKTYGFQYHFEWNKNHIEKLCNDTLVEKAGSSSQKIISEITSHYDGFRRQGDRLCQTIAQLLFSTCKA